jgi:hypothetical protein
MPRKGWRPTWKSGRQCLQRNETIGDCDNFGSVLRTGGAAQTTDAGEFSIPTSLHWQHLHAAPSNESVASAVVFYFGKDREIVPDECWLIRDGESIAISDGDPIMNLLVYPEPIADGMQLTYRLLRLSVERKGERLPGRETSQNTW